MFDRLTHSPLFAAWLVALGGAATIAGAWGFELLGGLEPCPLCLEQRWPFYMGIPLSALAIILFYFGRSRLGGLALVCVALATAYGAGLGIYHAGIEWELWAGPAACAGGGAIPESATDLLQSLGEGRVPSCADAPWRLFGLSLAGYNVLISAALALIAAAGARNALTQR